MNDQPVGVLEGNSVLVEDPKQASQLYNKGSHGVPESGGALRLSLLEAAYLVDADRLRVERPDGSPASLEDLAAAGGAEDGAFEVRYLVYRDMRERGYLVRPSTTPGVDLDVYPRGGTHKDEVYEWLLAVSERASFETAPFLEMLHRAETFGREVLVGVVDEEGDVTHYRARLRDMEGRLPGDGDGRFEGWAFGDRVLAFDTGAAEGVVSPGRLGRRLGDLHQLSLLEAARLSRQGLLSLRDSASGEPVGHDDFVARCAIARPDFELRLRVYDDLRERGLVVKTGFKYGTHFRAYDQDPDVEHARFLVHAVPRDHETSWPELSRAVRLAHGVRKELVFGAADEAGVEYIELERLRL